MEKTVRVDLSISIVNYNTRDLMRQCLTSIYDNTQDLALEVFVMDNGSVDGTADMIRQEFPTVNLICNKENLGVAAATNQALERVVGRHFITMNSDTVVCPGALNKLVDFMDAHPDAGAASARLIRPDGKEHPTVCGLIPGLLSEMLLAATPLSARLESIAYAKLYGPTRDWTKTQEVDCIFWGTALIVRKETIEAIGPQDPLFFIYSEDVDWSMRIAKAGWKQFYVAESEVIHYGGQSTKQASAKMLAMLHKNKCRLIQKHYGLIPGMILRLTFAGVWGIRLAKWGVIYTIRGRMRKEATQRMNHMLTVIRGVMTY